MYHIFTVYFNLPYILYDFNRFFLNVGPNIRKKRGVKEFGCGESKNKEENLECHADGTFEL